MNDSVKREISICRIISVFMVCFVFFGALALGGVVGAFIHIPSILFTFGLTFFLLLGVFGKDFLAFIPDAFINFFTVSPVPNPKFADIAKTGSRFIIGVGVVGTCPSSQVHLLRFEKRY